ncbi:MAG TPA: RdgB/HAM1 family non-canonical purine NTP pyrophosphatase [Phycisphaerales bacterium]|nr:RdgB/HAM1 family non-canonical purine NTP pyrophosphatase [Phycisphaerales bacterium]
MKVLFASSNPHKVKEVREILQPAGVQVMSLDDLPAEKVAEEPEEDGMTFAENARIKAIAYARASGMLTLADDSGLVVDALHGEPGVHSARYAMDVIGEEEFDEMPRAMRDSANNTKLLAKLKNVPVQKRKARFVCAMCLTDSHGHVKTETEGVFEGVIVDTMHGTNGFGYDPLLYVEDAGCTSAEMTAEEKNRRSHRGQAARKMVNTLRQEALGIKH